MVMQVDFPCQKLQRLLMGLAQPRSREIEFRPGHVAARQIWREPGAVTAVADFGANPAP